MRTIGRTVRHHPTNLHLVTISKKTEERANIAPEQQTDKYLKYVAAAIFTLACLVAIWFLMNNLRTFGSGLYTFGVISVIGLSIFLKLFAQNTLSRLVTASVRLSDFRLFPLATIILITLIGMSARILFYFKFSYAPPFSDPLTFLDAARRISGGQGIRDDFNISFFPYLAIYDYVLAFALEIIPNAWLAIISLNTLFDFAGATIAYLLVKKYSASGSRLPLLAFGLWFLSPLNIIFSTLSLPVIATNFFIIASIYLTYLVIRQINSRDMASTLALAAALGVVMGIGNCFRPVMPVMLIAQIILIAYLLSKRWSRQLLLFSVSAFVIICVMFFGIQKLYTGFLTHETGTNVPSNPSGWSMYVGANWNGGAYSQQDVDRLNQYICREHLGAGGDKNFSECHSKLREAAIERYTDYGLVGTINLSIRKLYGFSADQNYIFNAGSIRGYEGSTSERVVNNSIIIFVIILFGLIARLLYISANDTLRNKPPEQLILFLALLIIGFFFSALITEIAPRYAQIIYPAFTILGAISAGSLIRSIVDKFTMDK